MKKYCIYAVALAMIVFIAPRAFAKGSLAVGSGEHYGWAVNQPSYDRADALALENCTGECKVVYRFENTCAAYSRDGNHGATGWAHAPTREEAEKLAREECLSHGGAECPIMVWGCDSD